MKLITYIDRIHVLYLVLYSHTILSIILIISIWTYWITHVKVLAIFTYFVNYQIRNYIILIIINLIPNSKVTIFELELLIVGFELLVYLILVFILVLSRIYCISSQWFDIQIELLHIARYNRTIIFLHFEIIRMTLTQTTFFFSYLIITIIYEIFYQPLTT